MNKTSQDIIKAWNKANTHAGKGKHHIPKVTKAEVAHRWKHLKKTVAKEGKERSYDYFYNSSINCYRYLCDTTLMAEERFIWRLVHLTATVVAGFVIWVVATSSLNHRTGISQSPDGIPLAEIPYPAVAICPLNLLSKRRVQEYAKKFVVKQFDSENATMEMVNRMIYNLGFLGYAYDHLESPNDELYELHNLLQNYDLRNLIEGLSPQCKDIIVRCVWRGNLTDCSKIFTQRKTASGFCCTFNYVKQEENDFGVRRNRSNAIMAVYGQEHGLSVVVNPELEDYFYTRMPDAGMSVMIFNPVDFPDLSTGGGLDMYVAPMAEQYFSMSATVLEASPSLTSLDINVRQCIIRSDPFPYDTNSECYLMCKLAHIHVTCGCVPFYLPIQKRRTCDLQDEECLRRWKNTWTTAWLNEDADGEDENGRPIENHKEPPCSCLPSCADVKYKVQKYSIVLQPDALNAQNDSAKLPLKREVVWKNHSVVHIFFSKDNFVLLQNDVLFSWYDWLSNLGGLCGLVLGCSILSIAEIIYYFVFGGPVKESHKREPPARQLYWQELRRM